MKLEAIEDFLTRVKQLSRSNSKDMRLSFQEANLLALSISELLVDQLNKPQPVVNTTPTVIDGGSFKDRLNTK